jgi:hypothetical protein
MATTGLFSITGGTHTATGITSAADTALTFTPTDPARINFEDDYYVREFTIVFNKTGTIANGDVWTVYSIGATNIRMQGLYVDRGYGAGINLYFDDFTGSEFSFKNMDNGASSLPLIKLGQPVTIKHITFFDASAGYEKLIVDGVCVAETQGHNTTSYDYSSFAYTFGRTGLTTELRAPVTDTGTLPVSTVLPDWTDQLSNSNRRLFCAPQWDSDDVHGITMTPSSFTGVTITNFSTAQSLANFYAVTTGNNPTFTTMPLGAPQYGEDGYCTYIWMDICRNSTEVITLALRNAADDADVVSVNIDASDNLNETGVGVLDASLPTGWGSLAITFKADGTAYAYWCSQTDNWQGGATDQCVYGAALAGVTPASLGPAKLTISSNTGTVRAGSFMVASNLDVMASDSWVSTDSTESTYAHARRNRLTLGTAPMTGTLAVPNSTEWLDGSATLGGFTSFPPPLPGIIIGRSGGTITDFDTDVTDQIPPGWRIWFCESRINGWSADHSQEIAAFQSIIDRCDTIGSHIIVTSMLDRADGGNLSWDATDRAEVVDWNAQLLTLAKTNNLYFIDVAGQFTLDQSANPDSLWTLPDNTHVTDSETDAWWAGAAASLSRVGGWDTGNIPERYGYWANTPDGQAFISG